MAITRKQIKEETDKIFNEGWLDRLLGRGKKKEPEAEAQPEEEPEAPPEEDLTPAWEKAIENAAIALSSKGVWGSNELVKAMGNTWFHREIENNLTPGGWTQAHFQDALRKAFPLAVGPERIEYLGDVERMAYEARDAVGQKKWDRERERSSQKDDEYEWRGGDMRRVKTRRGYGSTQYESKANNSMSSLMENWRNYKKKALLSEDASADKVDPKRFPMKLSDVDPAVAKVVTRTGATDGQPDDDKVAVSPGKTFPVSQLNPSQSSMNIGKALAQALAMIQGDMDTGGDLGAFISNDNHIMDGHHRWVATTMVDPSKEVGGFLVNFPSTQLIAALNAVTKGRLGVNQGKKATGGFNQFEEGPIEQQLKAYLKNGIPGKFPKKPEYVLQAIEKFTGQKGNAAISAAVDKFVANLENVKPFTLPPGAPTRPDMPVIDPDLVPGALSTAVKALQDGELDLNEPYGKTDDKQKREK